MFNKKAPAFLTWRGRNYIYFLTTPVELLNKTIMVYLTVSCCGNSHANGDDDGIQPCNLKLLMQISALQLILKCAFS